MSDPDNEENVIHFTPEPGFTIEGLARTIVKAMREMDMDAQVDFPGITMDIEKNCTVGEIVEGYKEYVKTHIGSRAPSNRNEAGPSETE